MKQGTRLVLQAAAVFVAVLGHAAAQQMPANPRAVGKPRLVPGAPAESSAALTLYTDRAAWAAAAGGATTLVDFEAFPSGTLVTTELASQGIALVSGTSNGAAVPQYVTASIRLPFPMFTEGLLPSEPNFFSSDLASPIYATGQITFDFTTPATAVGAYVADSSPLGGFTIEVLLGGGSLGTVTAPRRTLPSSFVGVVSTAPFDSARFFSEVQGDSWGLDDLEHDAQIDVVIDFDDLRGQTGSFFAGQPVGTDALIDVEYVRRGVLFDSAGGGVALAAGGNPVSPPNVVTATGPGPVISYADPATATFWKGDRPGAVDFVQITFTNSTSPSTLRAFALDGTMLGSASGGASATLRVEAEGAIHRARVGQGPMAFDDFTFGGLQGATTGLAVTPALPGQAGRQNEVRVTGAQPGEAVLVVLDLGRTNVRTLTGASSRAALPVATNGEGRGTASFDLPASTAFLPLRVRGVSASGELTPLVRDVIAPAPARNRMASAPAPGGAPTASAPPR